MVQVFADGWINGWMLAWLRCGEAVVVVFL